MTGLQVIWIQREVGGAMVSEQIFFLLTGGVLNLVPGNPLKLDANCVCMNICAFFPQGRKSAMLIKFSKRSDELIKFEVISCRSAQLGSWRHPLTLNFSSWWGKGMDENLTCICQWNLKHRLQTSGPQSSCFSKFWNKSLQEISYTNLDFSLLLKTRESWQSWGWAPYSCMTTCCGRGAAVPFRQFSKASHSLLPAWDWSSVHGLDLQACVSFFL